MDQTSESANPYQSPTATEEKSGRIAAVLFRFRVIPATFFAFFGVIALGVGVFIVGITMLEALRSGESSEYVAILMVHASYLAFGVCWLGSARSCWRGKWGRAVGLAVLGPVCSAVIAWLLVRFFL
jgi:hypothetical protein